MQQQLFKKQLEYSKRTPRLTNTIPITLLYTDEELKKHTGNDYRIIKDSFHCPTCQFEVEGETCDCLSGGQYE